MSDDQSLQVPRPRQRLLSIQEMRDCDIFGVGNPIVDIIIMNVGDDFITSHNLPKNGTLLAADQTLFDDINNTYDIGDYSAGGSVQNALRFCQWVIGRNNSVANFVGAVADDHFGHILAQKVKDDGLNCKYFVEKGGTTGLSAILYHNSNKNKTVCTTLGASKKFDKNFLQANFWYCERSKIIVTSGHMIPGASYVINKYTNVLMDIIQYIDFLFCNDDEAIAFATIKGYPTKELNQVAKLMADEPKAVYDNPRIPNSYKSGRVVVISQKDKPVLLARTEDKNVKEIPVTQLKPEQIKDTTGAGDALLGGFLAMYMDGRELDFCIKCGIYCATECIQLPACTLPKVNSFES